MYARNIREVPEMRKQHQDRQPDQVSSMPEMWAGSCRT